MHYKNLNSPPSPIHACVYEGRCIKLKYLLRHIKTVMNGSINRVGWKTGPWWRHYWKRSLEVSTAGVQAVTIMCPFPLDQPNVLFCWLDGLRSMKVTHLHLNTQFVCNLYFGLLFGRFIDGLHYEGAVLLALPTKICAGLSNDYLWNQLSPVWTKGSVH